jgi:hypothetical protein
MKTYASLGRVATAFTLAGTLFFASCSKYGETSVQTNQPTITEASLEAEANSEIIFDDVFNNVMGVNSTVAIGGTGIFEPANWDQPGTLEPATAACFTLKFEFLAAPDTFPIKVTIDFGTGCTGKDGRVRKGKIITVYSGHMVRSGSIAETSFDNYYVNDIKVEGTHRIENKSTATQFMFETKVNSGKITYVNGDYINWTNTRLISYLDGWQTPWNPADDSFSIVGSGSGTIKRDAKTSSWTTANIEPLIKNFSCRWISKGKQAIQRNDGPQGILDFGNGDCDNKAIISVNGVAVEITLK